jgi:hypothetical protein
MTRSELVEYHLTQSKHADGSQGTGPGSTPTSSPSSQQGPP